MKPVKEIALMLDVSLTTVYNHISKLKDEIKPYTYIVKGITYLDEEGIRQLKISMGLLQVPKVREDISMNNIIDEISNSVTERLSININEVKEDIKTDMDILKQQVQDLQEQNKLLINLIENNQKVSLGQRIKGLFKSTE